MRRGDRLFQIVFHPRRRRISTARDGEPFPRTPGKTLEDFLDRIKSRQDGRLPSAAGEGMG